MLAIETRPIARLIPYVRNARTHSGDQIAQIAGSIAEFGFVNPVLIGADDVIIAGHGRVLAAEKLGLADIPVIVLSHLSESQRRALVIADNRIAENAGWDEAMLKAEIAALHEDAFDLDLLGFAEEELGRLLDGLDADGGGHAAADGELSSDASTETQRATLAERFGIPPFSVLDARKGWWQVCQARLDRSRHPFRTRTRRRRDLWRRRRRDRARPQPLSQPEQRCARWLAPPTGSRLDRQEGQTRPWLRVSPAPSARI